MKLFYYVFVLAVFASCGELNPLDQNSNLVVDTIQVTNDSILVIPATHLIDGSNQVPQQLPDWFVQAHVLDSLHSIADCIFDNRLSPLYLEEDFNGDQVLDIAIPIKQTSMGKLGFAIVHGASFEIFILGAGRAIRGGHTDNLDYVDLWKINRLEVNEPGLDEHGQINPRGPLHLSNPSVQIEKTDVGGGQLYWDGQGYVYFHQTC